MKAFYKKMRPVYASIYLIAAVLVATPLWSGRVHTGVGLLILGTLLLATYTIKRFYDRAYAAQVALLGGAV